MVKLRDDKIEIASVQELEGYCRELAVQLGDRAVVLLSGALGAGKTKTVEVLARLLGASEVASPTFALHHRYPTAKINIEHFDLYRIEGESDLESVGFWDIFRSAKGWIFIEWPERFERRHLPTDWQLVEVQIFLKEQKGQASPVRIYHTKFVR